MFFFSKTSQTPFCASIQVLPLHVVSCFLYPNMIRTASPFFRPISSCTAVVVVRDSSPSLCQYAGYRMLKQLETTMCNQEAWIPLEQCVSHSPSCVSNLKYYFNISRQNNSLYIVFVFASTRIHKYHIIHNLTVFYLCVLYSCNMYENSLNRLSTFVATGKWREFTDLLSNYQLLFTNSAPNICKKFHVQVTVHRDKFL